MKCRIFNYLPKPVVIRELPTSVNTIRWHLYFKYLSDLNVHYSICLSKQLNINFIISTSIHISWNDMTVKSPPKTTAKLSAASKPRFLMFWRSYRSEIRQVPLQHCHWGACLISDRLKKFKSEFHGFETTRSCDNTSVRLVNMGPTVSVYLYQYPNIYIDIYSYKSIYTYEFRA